MALSRKCLLLMTFVSCTVSPSKNEKTNCVKTGLNISSNSTAEYDYLHPEREFFENLLVACFAVTALISLVGNALVIHVVRTTPFMHTSVNIYIANMAVSDVISTLVCTPLMMKRLSQSYAWMDGRFGLVLCRVVFFFFYTSFACSTFNLVAIAIDRHLAVSKPLFRYSGKMVKMIVFVIWLSSALLSVPIVNGYSIGESYRDDGLFYCYDWDRGTTYNYGVSIMAFMCYVIPLAAATILYTLTGCTLRQRCEKTIGCPSDNRKRQASQAAFKAIKLMATIIAVFSLCWAPFFIYHLTKAWYGDKLYKILEWFHRPLSFLLASMNAAINPCLYFIFSDNYRTALVRMIPCCLQKRRESFTLEMFSSRVRSRSCTS